ncbi:YceI family protein [Tamlana sp. 2201CG12-4]|uniref:YceI family protein n=1 Tax=Tamlana sp. 2201CG12-4 TaxID=3112582 RepID=UPI002DBD5FA6|nr:YceI family protein [Tamlana sp. 2201CG12-4]MEC3906398.1 YceI family protein [Tamlana sp. 2201CG12-4]
MKKNNVLLVLMLCVVSLIWSQNATKIDTTSSVIKWTGSNLFKYNKHFGTVTFLNGEIIKSNNIIIGGHFEINMNSIINTDGKYNEMLVWHLKNEDFFNVEKYPVSRLEFIEVTATSTNTIAVKADLTIRDITNPIEFTLNLEEVEGKQIFTSKFSIDRTRWGIEYNSKGILSTLKNEVISDLIDFEVVVEAMDKGKC